MFVARCVWRSLVFGTGVLIQDFAYLRVPTCCDRDLACTAAQESIDGVSANFLPVQHSGYVDHSELCKPEVGDPSRASFKDKNHMCWSFLCSVLMGTLITRTCASQSLVIRAGLRSKIKSHVLVLPVFCARGYADHSDLCKQEFGDQSKALIKKKIACVGVPCVRCSLCVAKLGVRNRGSNPGFRVLTSVHSLRPCLGLHSCYREHSTTSTL